MTLRSGKLSVQRRHQPLRVAAPDTSLVAVVRIEASGVSPSWWTVRASVAREIAESATLPRVEWCQIDFDARQSDRPFYAALLRETRARLSHSTRLSMTALASWCADDPWIDATSVDDIVPMLFQMGPDARHVVTRLREEGRWRVDACNGAAGVSTTERWRGLPTARSVYVFNPRRVAGVGSRRGRASPRITDSMRVVCLSLPVSVSCSCSGSRRRLIARGRL